MEEQTRLHQALECLLGSGSVEVFEDGRLLPLAGELQFELTEQGGGLRIHLWCRDGNLVRRIQAVREISEQQIVLEVRRFGRRSPGRVEIVSHGELLRPHRMSRARFRARFGQLLEEGFPDERLVQLVMASDLEHSFSGAYARGIQMRGQVAWAVVGVAADEAPATIDEILTGGLLWHHWIQKRGGQKAVAGLRVFLPRGMSQVTVLRLRGLAPGLRVQVYEYDPEQWRAYPVDVQDTGNLRTGLTPLREVQFVLDCARPLVERIRALAPEAIDAVVPPGTREVAIRLHGLEIARWHDGRCLYGFPHRNRELTGHDWERFSAWVRKVAERRNPAARNRNDALYRAQPERWLEALVLRNPAVLEPQLNPAFFYAQVPAVLGSDRGVLDLLGVTRSGRLAVFELKATEHLPLPLQALDYWLKVLLHHRQDDFHRFGYFASVALQQKPPLLYLVAPALHFHSSLDTLLGYFSPEVEVVRVGLHENWRAGLRVVLREGKFPSEAGGKEKKRSSLGKANAASRGVS
jgi:hypothetical protein